MIVLDRLLTGGLHFVLDKIATAVDAEMNDEERWKEQLLIAQMQAELGEISDEELVRVEREVFERLREIRARRGEGGGRVIGRVAGAEVSFGGDEDGGEPRS